MENKAMENFTLHPQLAADCYEVTDLTLCKVLLMNDQNYPWLILVPKRADTQEIYHLPTDEQVTLWQEVSHCGEKLMQATGGEKLNIGALGNMVPQLHIHVIARFRADPAWPSPVWGKVNTAAYPPEKSSNLIHKIKSLLNPRTA